MTIADTARREDPAQAHVEQRPVFPVLDTLRAVGALAVLTTHTSFQAGDYGRHGTWGTILSRLDIGVALFFVLSGFLLARPYLARAAVGLEHPPTGRYYVKRVLRIYPVYLVTVVLALGLIDENADAGVRGWVRSLTLTDIYTVDRLPQGLTQMWSLAVESSFYLVLPVLMALALGRRRAAAGWRPVRVVAVLAALVACGIWWEVDLAARVATYSSGTPMSWLPSYLSWFAVGIGLALAQVQLQLRPRDGGPLRALAGVAAMPGVCWTLAGGLFLVAATPLAGPTALFVASPVQAVTKNLLYAAIAGLVVAGSVFAPPAGRYARVMSARGLRHLGHISYSVFCIHLPILHLVMTLTGYPIFAGHGLQIWAATAALSLLAAELLYRFVELPGMRLGQRRRGTAPGALIEPDAPTASSAAHSATTR